MNLETVGLEKTQEHLNRLLRQARVMAQKYDVVCTNPPYMGSSGMSAKLSEFVKANYPDSKSDLFAVFIERCGQMTQENGYQAMITQHAWMFLASFEKLRSKLQRVEIVNMAHLGARAFEEIGGEVVQTTSFVIRRCHTKDYRGEYCRLTEPTSQRGKETMFLSKNNRYTVKQSNFSMIPGFPFAYWASKQVVSVFSISSSLASISNPRQGLITGDVNRFVRKWHECSLETLNFHAIRDDAFRQGKWFPYCNGGSYRKWYGNNEDVVNWGNDGYEIINFFDDKGKQRSRPQNQQYYFCEGATWSAISTSAYSIRYFPSGCLFSNAGMAIYADRDQLMYIIGFLNSKLCQVFLSLFNEGLNYNQGDIAKLPIIKKTDSKIQKSVEYAIQMSKADWDSYETSWDFNQHPLIAVIAKNRMIFDDISKIYLAECYACWKGECENRFQQLKKCEGELNRIFIDIYGLQEELAPDVADKNMTVHRVFDSKDDVPESMKGSNYVRTMHDEVVSFISYAVGCMFGRYSLDEPGLAYAGGEWNASKYKTFLPDEDNCIPVTDEEYFRDDIVGRLVEFVRIVFGNESLEDNLEFIANALGNKGTTSREIIRNYFLNDFIKDHIKTYQKRPIYWMFDSGKQNGFKALVYMHRWNADTIGKVRVEYLHRIQRVYESEICRMQDTIDNSSNARECSSAQKRKDKLTKQFKESKDYDAKIAHLALARIDIDLDDGVKKNYEKVQTPKGGKKLFILTQL